MGAAYCNYYHHVVGPQNTWCNNWYCGGFCNSNSNAADNCEATIGNRQCCSEVFSACAEVKLVGESVPTPSTTSTTTSTTSAAPTQTTTAPGTTTPVVAPTSAPPAPTPTATPAPPAPATTPESEPEPEPEPEPESGTDGVTCTATPRLNRGVSDSDCAQCETGYKWWPCNEAELCECTGTALAQLGTKIEPKHSVRKNRMRKQSFLAPRLR